jgi:hypothetical protein
MYIQIGLWNIVIQHYGTVNYSYYAWLDLGMLYADGIRLKAYEEDYTPLLF